MRNDNSSRWNYLLEHFGRESALHKKITEHSRQEQVLGMQVSAYEGQMLKFFAQVSGARKVVEIGCLFGYSALWLLEALPEEGGELYLLEKEGSRVEWMKENFKDHPRFSWIKWRQGDAEEQLEGLRNDGPFDFCFIDANKAAYSTYLDWAEGNIRKGGLILGDNSFLWGGVYDEGDRENISESQRRSMKEFNRRLADPARYNSTLIPTQEGLTVAQKLF